jgi:23S rRNA (uracil1939-C5)-methyltransferase
VGGKRGKYPIYEKIEVLDIGAEGKAIARKDEMVIFVTNAIPGDVVDLQITKKRRNYQEGKAIHFHQHSSRREEAFCEHFGTCGGCKWQDLNYPDQLMYKQKQVMDQLQRIGKIDAESLSRILPIIPSDQTRFYRNKLEYTFSNKRWLTKEEMQQEKIISDREALGFHIPGMFDKILDIKECYLQPEPSNSIRLAIKDFAVKNKFEFFDLRSQEGFLRNLIIRTTTTGEVMVIVSFYTDDVEKRTTLLELIDNNFEMINSIMYVINSKPNDTIADLPVKCFAGKDHIIEEIGDLQFKIGPKSFFQTNSIQANNLYQVVQDFASLKGDEIVYDLYTGTGTIANFIARQCAKVIGIEQIPEAIEDAKENSTINGIENTRFFAGDMKDILTPGFYRKNGLPHVIILDPPRAGVHQKVIESIVSSNPDRIVYVSCNPATQARDIKLLLDQYTVEKIQPVDMFPHTHHVENVLLLGKKPGIQNQLA